ncbi:entericidin A/B family lipoprotein [Fretibacter rubidus]
MSKMIIKNVSIAVVTLAALATSACHTVEGVGKDLERAGDKAEEITRND